MNLTQLVFAWLCDNLIVKELDELDFLFHRRWTFLRFECSSQCRLTCPATDTFRCEFRIKSARCTRRETNFTFTSSKSNFSLRNFLFELLLLFLLLFFWICRFVLQKRIHALSFHNKTSRIIHFVSPSIFLGHSVTSFRCHLRWSNGCHCRSKWI